MSLALNLMAALVLLAASNKAPTKASHRAIFNDEGTWYLLDIDTRRASRVVLPPALVPSGLAVSQDGEWAVATVNRPEHATDLVRFATKDGASSTLLSTQDGHFDEPAFTAHQDSVLVSGVPGAGGMALNHKTREFAQIYEVSLKDGTRTKLTSEDGCHITPASSAEGQVVLIHAACFNDGRNLEVHQRGKPIKVIKGDGSVRDLSMPIGAKQFVYAHAFGAHMLVTTLDVLSGATGREFEIPGFEQHPQPQLDAAGNSVFFLCHHKIWVNTAGTNTVVIDLKGEIQ